ncbi:CheY-like superfamily [Kalaharituber pfeilii]|nr:CheY-like superfamily [Kalaharituber pfeilii]
MKVLLRLKTTATSQTSKPLTLIPEVKGPSSTIAATTERGPIEVCDVTRYNIDEGDALPSLRPKPGLTLPARISALKERVQIMKDGISETELGDAQLPPLKNSEPNSQRPEPASLPDIEQLTAANWETSQLHGENGNQESSSAATQVNPGRTMKRTPLPSRYTGLSCSRPILLIDDDPLCRRLLILFFNSMKQEVDWASDGITAIEKINHHRYSMIYMDPIMPYLDGVSTTRLIRESDQEIPIICMLSNTALDDASVYKETG